jgi:hypothetical protein
MPFAVSMQTPAWLPTCEIRLRPRKSNLKQAKAGMLYNSSCGTFSTWVYQDALYQEIGKLSLGIQRIDFDAEVEAGDGTSFMTKAEGPPTGLLWQGPMSFNLDVVATLDEAVRPLKGEEIDAGVRESLGVAFSNWGANDERTALLVLDPDTASNPSLAGVALSLKIEVLSHGAPVESLHLFASDYDRLALSNSVSKGDQKAIAFCTTEKVPAELEANQESRASWTLRLTGTSEHVQSAWDATGYWAGTLEVPIDEAIRGEQTRAGPSGRGPWVYSPSRR